jgi:hypothetical protein
MTTTIEPCVCGGFVTADPENPAEGVTAHQRTRRHRAWRGLRYQQCAGVEGVTCVVSVPLDRRLCHFCLGTLRLLNQRALAA